MIIPSYLRKALKLWAVKISNQVGNYKTAQEKLAAALKNPAVNPAKKQGPAQKETVGTSESGGGGSSAAPAAPAASEQEHTADPPTGPDMAATAAPASLSEAPPQITSKDLKHLKSVLAKVKTFALKPAATGKKAASAALLHQMHRQELADAGYGTAEAQLKLAEQVLEPAPKKRKVSAKQQAADSQNEAEQVRKAEGKSKRDAAAKAAFLKANKPEPTLQGV